MPRRQTGQTHLESRPTGYFWRRRSPRNQAAEKKSSPGQEKFFVFSLRTQVLREAKAVAARLTDISDQVFAVMTEKTMPIAPEIAEQILVDMARFLIESFDRQRALAPTRSLAVAEEELRQEQAWRTSLKQSLFCRDRGIVRPPLRETALRLGITLDEDGPDWLNLAIEATKLLIDVSEECERRDRGETSETTPWFRSARALVDRIGHRAPSTMPVAAPAASMPAWMGSNQADVANQASVAHPVCQSTPSLPAAAASAPAQITPASMMQAAPTIFAPTVAVTMPLDAVQPTHTGTSSVAAPGFVPEGVPHPTGSTLLAHPTTVGAPHAITPAQISEEFAIQQAKLALRPPKIMIDISLLKGKNLAAIQNPRGITLRVSLPQ